MVEPEQQTNTQDIISATQNAVIDAVNSVSQIIEKQTEESTFEKPSLHEPCYLSAEFWVGIAFILAVIMLAKPVAKAFKALLNKRRENIIATLAEAENLHMQAQALLAKYERQLLKAPDEIAKLTSDTEEELQAYAKEKTDTLEKELVKKQLEAQNTIDAVVSHARADLQTAVSKETLDIVQTYLKQNLTDKTRADLIDASIEQILKRI